MPPNDRPSGKTTPHPFCTATLQPNPRPKATRSQGCRSASRDTHGYPIPRCIANHRHARANVGIREVPGATALAAIIEDDTNPCAMKRIVYREVWRRILRMESLASERLQSSCADDLAPDYSGMARCGSLLRTNLPGPGNRLPLQDEKVIPRCSSNPGARHCCARSRSNRS
jgi:hypothetical protein